MTLEVRLADLQHESEPLIELLNSQLSSKIDSARFDWLYRKGPHGEAKVWVAKDAQSGAFVGAAAAFPRRIFVTGKAEAGCVLGDFCVSAKYRSLGPALQLQRKCIEAVGRQTGQFLKGYDLPSTSMLAVYRRLGVQATGRFVRMARLLRSARKVQSKVRLRPAAHAVSTALDAMLGWSGGSLRTRSDAKLEMLQGRCGHEYTELAERVRDRWGICVARSADYLNWRYLDHPQRKYQVAVARRARKLTGYVVWEQNDGIATVADWYAEEPKEIRLDLMRMVIARAKQEGAESVNASVPAGHELQRDLKSLGFRAREGSPMIFLGNGVLENEKWLLLDGDRES